jgi:RND family efflux transporter MFP subunit
MMLRRLLPVLLLSSLALAGCKKSEGGKGDLPPATGDGAAPLPEIPGFKNVDAAPQGGVADTGQTTGSLEAKQQVSVAPKASGTIVDIKVDEGSKVKKGDVLFRLDSRDAQLAKKSAETQLKGAKLQLKTAQIDYDRISGLVAQNAASKVQLDAVEANLVSAMVGIQVANNSIAVANKAIGDATVRSPIDGVVIQKVMSVGEYATMMPPSPVVILQDQSSLEVKFGLPERSLATIKPKDAVTVSIPAIGATREATIAQISPMVDAKTRTVQITVVLDNKDGSLKPGMMAEVSMGATPAETPKPAEAVKPTEPKTAKEK